MEHRSAIVIVPDDTKKTGQAAPLLLQRVMGAPLLRWLADSLTQSQVSRFFLVCKKEFMPQAQGCFPAEAELMTTQDDNPADMLHVFLSTADEAEEDVLVITGPVVYAPQKAVLDPGKQPHRANACMADRQELMNGLDTEQAFGHFLMQHSDACTDREGFFSVNSPEELAQWAPVLRNARLDLLVRSGVEIWDYNSCYVSVEATVGAGAVLLPGTNLQGATTIGYGAVIGPNSCVKDSAVGNHARINNAQLEGCTVGNHVQIGPYACLRPGTVVENGAKIGAFVELSQATIGPGAEVSHLSCLGDCTVGENAYVGVGAVTANVDRVSQKKTTIEQDAFVGCNTSLVAPVTVGRGAYVAAGSIITENVPAQALGIARGRQTNRKDWALKNKK